MSISLPEVTLAITPAQQTAGVVEQRVLMVAQMLAAGTATAGELIQDFPNDGSEDTLFDATSQMAAYIRAFKQENQVSKLDVIPLADAGAAVKGASIITLGTGPAGDDAEVYVTIGSKETYRKKITIASADTITEIGDAIVAAFASETKKPFTLANNTGVVTITAANGGTGSNNWGLVFEGTIQDVTVVLTGWTGGTGDPVLTGVLDPIDNIRYQTILWPSNYDLSLVQTLLDARFNFTNAVMDGVVIQTKVDTLANLKSYVSTLNSQSVVVPTQKLIADTLFKGPATVEFPDVAAAQICAIRALRRTNGASLTQYLTTVAPDDQFGGVSLASLPYFNTSLPNMAIAEAKNEFSGVDLTELSTSGLSSYGPNQAFNGTILGELVTTYLTDVAGNPDDSFKFLNTVDTESVVREFFFNNLKATYAQTRLTDGDLVAGRDMENRAGIIAYCNELYDLLADLVIVQKGTEAKKDFNQNLVVTVNVRTGIATINMAPLLVSQLRSIIGTIQVNFGG